MCLCRLYRLPVRFVIDTQGRIVVLPWNICRYDATKPHAFLLCKGMRFYSIKCIFVIENRALGKPCFLVIHLSHINDNMLHIIYHKARRTDSRLIPAIDRNKFSMQYISRPMKIKSACRHYNILSLSIQFHWLRDENRLISHLLKILLQGFPATAKNGIGIRVGRGLISRKQIDPIILLRS